jgi:hypothetical protein
MNEFDLKSELELAVASASKTMVCNDSDYLAAGNTRKEIKFTINRIKAYWEPKKDQAFQLHKSLVAAEKDMLSPLEQADKLIDQRMGEYRKEQERLRLEAEREQRRLAEEARKAEAETARLVAEAQQKDELDDEDVAILMMAQAEADRTASIADVIVPEPVKMAGITIRKVWKARILDESLIPIRISGIIIRPIDQSALNKLAVASSGAFECPGVEFYQEEFTSVRL